MIICFSPMKISNLQNWCIFRGIGCAQNIHNFQDKPTVINFHRRFNVLLCCKYLTRCDWSVSSSRLKKKNCCQSTRVHWTLYWQRHQQHNCTTTTTTKKKMAMPHLPRRLFMSLTRPPFEVLAFNVDWESPWGHTSWLHDAYCLPTHRLCAATPERHQFLLMKGMLNLLRDVKEEVGQPQHT